LPWVNQVLPVKTNIVIIQLKGNLTSAEYVAKLTQKGIMCAPFGPQNIRFVTHLNVGDEHVAQFEKLIKQI
jgi:threonine aldolase